MNSANLRNKLLAVAVGGVLALGVATQASATFNWTYDLDGIAGGRTVVANSVSGGSSDHLFVTIPGSEFQGGGWAQFDALKFNSATIANTSYADTGLYALFTVTTKLTSGTFGQSGSLYDVTGFNFTLHRDMLGNNVFNQAFASSGTLATVGGTGEDALLGGGQRLFGDAGLHTTFGASINVKTDFALMGVGSNYFIDPVPFYEMALAGFNSTGGNWQFNAATGMLSIGSATGIVEFVPEPGSLALVGLGLVALAAKRRRT